MTNYANSKIYKLVNTDTKQIYIGSTTRDLKLRFNNSSDTRFRFKIRLISQTVVNPNNGQAITKVRVIIPDVNLKVYLEPNSGTSMLKFSSSGSSDMSVFWTNILPANSMNCVLMLYFFAFHDR